MSTLPPTPRKTDPSQFGALWDASETELNGCDQLRRCATPDLRQEIAQRLRSSAGVAGTVDAEV